VTTAYPYVPGLAGIPAAESAISYIDGEKGVLEYRGHRIETLAARSTFEETAWLLLTGRLPTAHELAAFRDDLRAARVLPRFADSMTACWAARSRCVGRSSRRRCS
jgi:citrate synthase